MRMHHLISPVAIFVFNPSVLLLCLCFSLDLSSNGVTGTIPSEIGQLSELHTIDVMSNKLQGTIPTAMLKLNRNLRLNFTDNL